MSLEIEVKDLRRQKKKIDERLNEIRSSLVDAKGRKEALEALIEEAEQAAAAAFDGFIDNAVSQADIDLARANVLDVRNQKTDLESLFEAYERKIPVLEKELKGVRVQQEKAEKTYWTGMAGELSQKLRANKGFLDLLFNALAAHQLAGSFRFGSPSDREIVNLLFGNDFMDGLTARYLRPYILKLNAEVDG